MRQLNENIVKIKDPKTGDFVTIPNLILDKETTVEAEHVKGLSEVAKTGKYTDLIGAPDPNDLIVDAGIEVGDIEPERTSIDVWIDTNENQTTYRIPEVKDNLISEQDTWSSKKIDTFVRSSGAGIFMHAEAPEDENINLWLDTELSDGESIRVPEINDEVVSLDDTWSSSKIQSEIAANASGAQDLSTLFNLIYPVGSIYTSANPTNPSTLFGGTWVQIKDTFLLTAGDTYIAGTTGGEAEHTLALAEMPNFRKPVYCGTVASPGYMRITWSKMFASSANGYYFESGTAFDPETSGNAVFISHTDGDQPHNNMPPYLVVYAWQRTE